MGVRYSMVSHAPMAVLLFTIIEFCKDSFRFKHNLFTEVSKHQRDTKMDIHKTRDTTSRMIQKYKRIQGKARGRIPMSDFKQFNIQTIWSWQ